MKVDGLPGYYVDRFAREKDRDGRPTLPWFNEVFYRNGTRVPNFYTRGMSISGPAWGQIDSGQHAQIKGNVEYDRFSSYAYDYLNFIPYYIDYGKKTKMDMPAAEVMDQLGIRLLVDAFPYERRYTSQQLYQRGNHWEILASGFVKLYPGSVGDMIDEWTMGLDLRNITINQVERDIVGKLVKNPEIDYFDYYDVSFDHVSHHNNDTSSRLRALKELDLVIGRIWTAIQRSSRAHETALILVSDHGTNSDERVYSQGFNLVRLLASREGGGHHVVTKRRLMLDYSVKGIYPLAPLIKTGSKDSYYLPGQAEKYSTVRLDFDGNERSTAHFRNSDLNLLHILFSEMRSDKGNPDVRSAMRQCFFDVIDRNRASWFETRRTLSAELDALARNIEARRRELGPKAPLFDADERRRGMDKEDLRQRALLEMDVQWLGRYRSYLRSLGNLLDLDRTTFDAKKWSVEDLIHPDSMGEANTVHQLQNYVVGMSLSGPVINEAKQLDLERSFVRVNYFDLLARQRVKNNVQPHLGNKPIDLVAMPLNIHQIRPRLPEADRDAEIAFWAYGDDQKQAIILEKLVQGKRWYRYLPVAGLRQLADGTVTFERREWSSGFPFRYFEDEAFGVPPGERANWIEAWHPELEWIETAHRSRYAIAVIGLAEQLTPFPLYPDADLRGTSDESLLRRFRQRQRSLTEADLLIMANAHWNFDVRGFNPGGNHGSFLRVSSNPTFMIAGGSSTGIPAGLEVASPYDSLSFVPTVLRLMGHVDERNLPDERLRGLGFRRFPGRLIREITGN